MSEQSSDRRWFLEGSVDGAAPPTRFRLSGESTRVGRDASLEVVLPVGHVSTWHAELYFERGALWLRDLGSSNGTRLNERPLEAPAQLSDGDIVQFAGLEFVIGCEAPVMAATRPTSLLPSTSDAMGPGMRSQLRSLRRLIEHERARVEFQPIVDLRSGERIAFEQLGRGDHEALPPAPVALFELADTAGLAPELSDLFRRIGAHAAQALGGSPQIFFNAHAAEVGTPALVESLTRLRREHPALRLVLEVHEATVTDPRRLQELRAALVDLDIPIAFDDFGAGQARLLELAEAPPDYLKFDMSLIRDIDSAPGSRRSMVERLVTIVKDAGVLCLAEGIETRAELDACKAIGFELAQGYLLGRPQPVEYWSQEAACDVTQTSPIPIARRGDGARRTRGAAVSPASVVSVRPAGRA